MARKRQKKKHPVDHEQMWEMMTNYMTGIKGKAKNPIVHRIIARMLDQMNKFELHCNDAGQWITTSQACKMFKITRQGLHQSGLTPNRLDKRKLLWNKYEVKQWRRGVADKRVL